MKSSKVPNMSNEPQHDNNTGNGSVIKIDPIGTINHNNRQEVVTMSQDTNNTATLTDEQLYTNVIDNATKRGQGGESVMGVFREKLKMILDRIDKDPKVSPKQIKAGAVSNALKGLFTNVDVNNQYGRSYRYLKQMGQTLRTWGWELKSVNGTQFIVKASAGTAAADPAASTAAPDAKKAAAGA